MAREKRTACYPEKFKRDAIRLTAETGQTTKAVADRLGVHPNQITRWKRELGAADGRRPVAPGVGPRVEREENELRRKRAGMMLYGAIFGGENGL